MKPKRILIATFSILWIAVSLVRMPANTRALGNLGSDPSWVMGLAANLQHDSISGRDFHFTYGPLAQVLAWLGTAMNAARSPFDAVPLILVIFEIFATLLFASLILLLKDLRWQETAFLCVGIALLNLFGEPTAFRTLSLMVCFAMAYRTLSAPRYQNLLTVITGLFCFAAQTLSLDMGLYAITGTALCFAAYSLRSRNYLTSLGILVGTYFLCNLTLSAIFTLTSDHYRFAEYQRYGLEIIRGYSYGMGVPWALPALNTIGLFLAALSGLAVALWRRQLLLTIWVPCVLLSMKGASIRSDLGHITTAFSPAIFLFLMVGPSLLRRRKIAFIGWSAVCIVLLISWPLSGFYFFSDLVRGISYRMAMAEKIKGAMFASNASQKVYPGDCPMLCFPMENYLAIQAHHPIVAPVLQSYSAQTVRLQRYYVQSLNQHQELEVAYSLSNIDDVQTVSRVPIIFEYLTQNFELASTGPPYLLKRRTQPRKQTFEGLGFTVTVRPAYTEIRLAQPSHCSLVRLGIKIRYPQGTLLFRPSNIAVSAFRNDKQLQAMNLVASSVGSKFFTFLNIADEDQVAGWFGPEHLGSKEWDTLRLQSPTRDWLDSPAKFDIDEIACIKCYR